MANTITEQLIEDKNNSQLAIDDDFETFFTFRLVVQVYMTGVVCLIGIACNVISIIVLGRDETMRATTRFMLQMLAVADVVFLIGGLFKITIRQAVLSSGWIAPESEFRLRLWPYAEIIVWPMASIAMLVAIWMVVLVTADRYLVVCWPTKALRHSTLRRARVAVCVVWVSIIVGSLPRFFERELIKTTMTVRPTNSVDQVPANVTAAYEIDGNLTTTESPELLRPVVLIQTTAVYNNTVYKLVYLTTMFFLFEFLLPFGLLTFFNYRLITSVRQSGIDSGRIKAAQTSTSSSDLNEDDNTTITTSGDKHNNNTPTSSSSSSSSNERRLTLILIVIVSVFFVCVLPIVVSRVYDVICYFSGYSRTKRGWLSVMYFNVTSNLLLPMNSAANFFVYCLMGQRFREVLRKAIFCGHCDCSHSVP